AMVGPAPSDPDQVLDTVRELVGRGLRAQLRTANYLTGQSVVALDFFPQAQPATVAVEGKDIVLPSQPTDLENITRTLTDLSQKLQRMPLDEIAQNLNRTLQAVDQFANGPDLKNALQSLAATMTSTQTLVHNLDAGMAPALRRLPEISAELQATLQRTSQLAGSVNGGYGENSEFRRDLERLLSQVSDTARSVRLLADFLDQHPEALIRGRSGSTTER
ncbi:MAG: paraquat-inducible protein B, partial [Acetobacteraceae bacterium]|nr:paraquat-inducible protein B [Acetobacteraceae bacterium]